MLTEEYRKVLTAIERTARKEHLPIMGQERGNLLAEIVRKSKPKRVLEVGTLIGYSAILMAKELNSDAELITIEVDRSEAEAARENIREAKVKPKVQVLVGDASKIIPELKGKFDLVFLDGAKSEYLRHLKLLEDKLRKGSIIVADNAEAFAYLMRDYLDYVRNSGKYESFFIHAGGDGLEVSRKL